MISLVPTAEAAVDSAAFGKVIEPIVKNVVNPLVGLVFAIAVVVFAYGVFQVIWNAEDGDARTRGKNAMWGGLIGMFIMVSAWGIIYLVSNTVKSL